jgi:redox-sensitive bicupin YhaK (pirin superfamily)
MKANEFTQILSPNKNDDGVWIYQDAWFNLGKFDKATKTDYQFKNKPNGLYVFALKGNAKVDGQDLAERDGFGIWDTESVTIEAAADSQILLMEVPMNF